MCPGTDPPSLLSADRYSLLSSTLRNSNVSRHRPPRALYGPGRSEMVACLSGSLRATAKAADLVSRRSSAKSRAAKKIRRSSRFLAAPSDGRSVAGARHPARVTARDGGTPRRVPRVRTWRERLGTAGVRATGVVTTTRHDPIRPNPPRDPVRRRRSATTNARGISESRLVASVGALGLDEHVAAHVAGTCQHQL